MDSAAQKLLDEHLPYELEMLDGSMEFLSSPNFAEYRKNRFLLNSALEAFWTHARNLNEFIDKPRNKTADGVAAARDFTIDTDPLRFTLDDALKTKINEHVLHLQYQRPQTTDGKLVTYDMHRVYAGIVSAFREFESRLRSDAKTIWKPWKPKEFVWATSEALSTGYGASLSTVIKYTGYTDTKSTET